MKIGREEVQNFGSPYVIAEISSNHHQDLQEARDLVESAGAHGASAVKFQTYSADGITLDSNKVDFQIDSGPWKGKTLYELYKESAMDWSWNTQLRDLARDLGMAFISSAFDFRAVDELVKIGADAIKIASFEAVDTPLISYAASTGLPLIISTGIATQEEIGEAIDAAGGGVSDYALMHCISSYPAPPDHYTLHNIPDLAQRHKVTVGLSDHTRGNATAVASLALGTPLFEKHFTLDSSAEGSDDFFSADPSGLRRYVEDLNDGYAALSGPDYSKKGDEKYNARFRRSLYFVVGGNVGDVVTEDHVRSIRPGFGLHPRHIDQVVGSTLAQNVEPGDRVSWDQLLLDRA